MADLKEPRDGWYWRIGGQILLHFNWSRAWDGWAVDEGAHRHWKLLSLEWIKDKAGYAVELVAWRAMFVIGFVATKPRHD